MHSHIELIETLGSRQFPEQYSKRFALRGRIDAKRMQIHTSITGVPVASGAAPDSPQVKICKETASVLETAQLLFVRYQSFDRYQWIVLY